MGIGFYFIFLRPPLLPEDLRFLTMSASQLEIINSRLTPWLSHVFTVLVGHAFASGTLIVHWRGHRSGIGVRERLPAQRSAVPTPSA